MVRSALMWSVAGQATNFLVNFVGSVVIARLLTPHEMGVYAVAVAAIGILQLFTSFGVGFYAVREENLTVQTMDAAFSMNVLMSAVLGLSLFAVSFAGARLLGEPAVASVLQILAITPLISSMGFTPGVMLQRAMLFRGVSIIGTVNALVTTGVTIGTALAGARYLSPAYGALASSIFSSVAMILIGREHFALRLSMHGWRKMFAFGLRMMSISGISAAAGRVSDVILGNLLGLSALGLYSRATNITNLLFQNVYGTLTRVVFAKLSQTQRDGGDVSLVYLRGLRLITGVMGPILIGLAILAGPVLRLLYGEKWLGAAVPLSLLLVGQFISLGFAMNWELFVIRDRMQTQTRLEIARSVLGVVTQLIGCLFNLIVVAATSIFDNLISLLLYGRHMPALANTTQRHLTRIYGEASLLTAVTVAPALIFMFMTGWNSDASLVALSAVVLSSVVTWLAFIWKTEHPLADELARAFRLLRARMSSSKASRSV